MLLDLGLIMASHTASKTGQQRKNLWLDLRTHRSLRDMAGAALLAAWGNPAAVSWSKLSERVLEKRFGRVRSSFPNSRMSTSDYWRSSCMQMRREMAKADLSQESQVQGCHLEVKQ